MSVRYVVFVAVHMHCTTQVNCGPITMIMIKYGKILMEKLSNLTITLVNVSQLHYCFPWYESLLRIIFNTRCGLNENN